VNPANQSDQRTVGSNRYDWLKHFFVTKNCDVTVGTCQVGQELSDRDTSQREGIENDLDLSLEWKYSRKFFWGWGGEC
jgi:hypothetical protein